jgi:hypothetical protein
LGIAILENARDITGAYLTVASETNKFSKSVIKASAFFRNLKKGKTDSDSVFGSQSEYLMQLGALSAGGAQAGNQAFEEAQMFINGNATQTPSFQRMGQSYRDMRKLSENWSRWARSVEQRSHLNSY